MPNYRSIVGIGIVLFQLAANAQVSARQRYQQIAEPMVPPNGLEFVTGSAQPVDDMNKRAEIVNLLAESRRNSNVRAQPYDLKTTFTVFGSSPSAGTWQEEDVSPGSGLYRWTVQGPGYAVVNLNKNRIFYSNQPANSLPLRLAQVRAAIFYTEPGIGPQSTLRTATATYNGTSLVCALISNGMLTSPETAGRRWEEAEYCLDPKAGTLISHSPVPGSYTLYDYSKNLRFHGKLIANKFTIQQAGQPVVEAQTQSVTDPSPDSAAFEATGLNPIGVGPIMSGPWRMGMVQTLPKASSSGTSQVVVLHGMQQVSGRISDVELLSSSDPTLNDAALSAASQWTGAASGQGAQNGTTPQSHEVLLTVRYVPR